MKLFKNIKIAYKLAIAFSLLVGFLLASSIISIKNSNQLADLTKKIHDHPLAVGKAVRDIQYNIQLIHNKMHDLATTQIETADLNPFKNEIKSIQNEIKEDFDIIMERFLGDKSCIISAQVSCQKWFDIIEREFELANRNDKKELAIVVNQEATTIIENLTNEIEYVRDFANNKGDEFYQESILHRQQSIQKQLFIFSTIILFAALTGYITTKSITTPLRKSVSDMRELAKGNLDIEIIYDRHDELGIFQQAMESLRQALEQISDIAHQISIGNLEVIAVKRSVNDKMVDSFNEMIVQLNNIADFANEISMGNLGIRAEKRSEKDTLTESLNSMVGNLASSQDKVIKSEKMAMLGSLISGVAHEINTPLAAIQSSCSVIESSYDNLFKKNMAFSSEILEAQEIIAPLLPLLQTEPLNLSSREKRELVKKLTARLEEINICTPKEIASLLIDINFTGDIQKIQPLLESPSCKTILETLNHYSNIRKSSCIINSGIEKTTKIINALKNYIYQKNDAQKTSVDLVQNIDSVMTLYHNKIKNLKDLSINLEYKKQPSVMCLPGKLNQVWTNLINNALYAMGDNGTLSITVDTSDDNAIVTISDTGCGIPEEIQKKIFEPLFTTKPIGEGTGLGLDICSNIIKEHDGEIELESVYGKGTVFTIKLPLSNNAKEENQQAEMATA